MTEYGPLAVWTVILAAGLGTLCFRLSFVLLFGRIETVPPRIVGALRFVPAAVLAALVAPSFLALAVAPGSGGGLLPARLPTFAFETPKLVAGAAAALVAWRTENVLATIATGMVVLWTVQAII